MIVALLGILLAVAVGLPLALIFDRRCSVSALLGEAFLVGIAVCGLTLFALALVGIRWSLPSLLMVVTPTVLAAWMALEHRRPSERLARFWSNGFNPAAGMVHLVTLAGLVGYALYATASSLPESDFIGNWGLKGRMFYESRGIVWSNLGRLWHREMHPDYPPLLPMIYDYMGVLRGGWDDQWLGLLFPAFGASTLLIINHELRRESNSSLFAAVATLALFPFALSPWLGIAEGPLIAFATSGLLLVRRGEADGDPKVLALGAILLGLAGFMKNEGIAFIASAMLAHLLTHRRWRRTLALWPALVVPVPWLVIRLVHRIPTDIATGSIAARVVDHLSNPGLILEMIARNPTGKTLYWTGIVLALILAIRRRTRVEKFLLGVVGIQLLFYMGAYLATPHEVGWHVRWSWERLVSHIALATGFASIAMIMPLLVRRGESPEVVAAGSIKGISVEDSDQPGS